MSPSANRRRTDYPFFLSYRTRWSDNDQYAHVNNAVYHHLIDAVISAYLNVHCRPKPTRAFDGDGQGDQIPLVVSSFCEFFAPLSFPDVLDLGLRVTRLGKSSVTYEVGVFRESASGTDSPAAVGGYTHVFVNKQSRTSEAINAWTRAGLEKLLVEAHLTKL